MKACSLPPSYGTVDDYCAGLAQHMFYITNYHPLQLLPCCSWCRNSLFYEQEIHTKCFIWMRTSKATIVQVWARIINIAILSCRQVATRRKYCLVVQDVVTLIYLNGNIRDFPQFFFQYSTPSHFWMVSSWAEDVNFFGWFDPCCLDWLQNCAS